VDQVVEEVVIPFLVEQEEQEILHQHLHHKEIMVAILLLQRHLVLPDVRVEEEVVLVALVLLEHLPQQLLEVSVLLFLLVASQLIMLAAVEVVFLR